MIEKSIKKNGLESFVFMFQEFLFQTFHINYHSIALMKNNPFISNKLCLWTKKTITHL